MYIDFNIKIFFVVWIYKGTFVASLEIPSDPRDLFPETGVGDKPLRTLHLEEYTVLSNKTVPDPFIPTFTTRSLTECSMQCMQYFCLSIFFNFDRLECTLQHSRYYNNSLAVEDLGSRYYLTFNGKLCFYNFE